jgi:predicted transcriptional regulator
MPEGKRVVTAQLPEELVLKMDEVSERIQRTKSWIVRQAVAEWLQDEQRRCEFEAAEIAR